MVSIVIVSWNTRELLRKCLNTVRQEAAALGPGRVETIVVDNASSDESAVMVRRGFPEVSLVEHRRNAGFAAANNLGIARAGGRYILLLNPDTELRSGSLAALVDFMEVTPRAGAAGARLVNADGSAQISAYPMPTLGRELWRLMHLDAIRNVAVYPLERWDQRRAHPVEVAQGACLMIRMAALEEVGTLDENYFMYTEEVDLCYRLKRAGWGVFWVPGARVLHHGGQSTRQVSAEMFLRLYESKIRFFRKHHGESGALAYKAVLILASVPRVLLAPLQGLVRRREGGTSSNTRPNYLRLLRALPGL